MTITITRRTACVGALAVRLCRVGWREGALKPAIHAAFPLAQFREAMAEVRERRSAGRVILCP